LEFRRVLFRSPTRHGAGCYRSRPPSTPRRRRTSCSSRASRSASPYSARTCSATRSATRSIRGCAEADGGARDSSNTLSRTQGDTQMPDARLAWIPATELAAMIRRKKVSPVEVVEEVLAGIEKLNPRLNAYATVVDEAARRDV